MLSAYLHKARLLADFPQSNDPAFYKINVTLIDDVYHFFVSFLHYLLLFFFLLFFFVGSVINCWNLY